MKTPKLKFEFNPEFDFNLAWEFYNNPNHAGANFWNNGALKHHSELKDMDFVKKKKDFLFNYINRYYEQQNNRIEKRKKEIEVLYDKKHSQFFDEIGKIFKDYPWPKGKYIAYLSIFDFCPRFLNDKTFFVFVDDNDQNMIFTISHEMLHFIFYDYCLAKHSDIFKKQDTESGPFWEIAEIFNVVVQQTHGFIALHGKINNGYPDLKPKIKSAKDLWTGDIDSWIKSFDLLSIKE